MFRGLQNEVKLCNFSARYMLSNMMKDIDKSYWEYGAARKKAKEVAKNFLLDGLPIERWPAIRVFPSQPSLNSRRKSIRRIHDPRNKTL